ncbi:MAG TPA: DegT/DnrJ/EryC1/StrS family aminotransferase [Armatimonadota bacterium]|nr:DegT/DnrJ/EryC1/StrS family aminotransferase [Armatimonadota bacterium]HOS43565.1 DegT/DnrJ/EryC1/StrS family aminotransferase [Armatimonadota bacterium]
MLRLTMPLFDGEELEEVRRVLETGYLTQGPCAGRMEEAVRGMVGTAHAFAMSSATTALHLSLVALGIGPGDEVLVPDFTFPATANVVVQQGATPVLVDVRPDTYALDPDALAARVTPRTRAVIPVHPFGLSAEMDPILAFARARGLAVIEDAACALGAGYRGAPCGALGDLGCFSFHPRKSVTTGEGGMITTDRDDLAARIRLLRSHGGVRGDYYLVFEDAGFNYRMSDLQAAVGVAQMRKLPAILARKRALALRYTELLQNVPGVTPPIEPEGCLHTFQTYVVALDDALDRDAIIAALRERDIETTLGTYALHAQPFFQRAYGYAPGDLPISYRLFRQTLALPLFAQMTAGEQERVAAALAACLAMGGVTR